MLPKVFISYRRGDDAKCAQALRDAIAQRTTAFFDRDNISGGAQFRPLISDGIAACHVFLMVIGQGWIREARRLDNEEDFVRQEFLQAHGTKRVIPICVGVSPQEVGACLPPALATLAELNFADWDDDVVAMLYRLGIFYPVKLLDPHPVQTSGRDNELAWIASRLGYGRSVVNLLGVPGVGKSRLALEYAHDAGRKQRYPGGLCWIDVKGAAADDEIVEFLRKELSFEADGKDTRQRAINGWARWSQQCPEPKLVIFDNVAHADRIKDLMPNAAHKFDVIVTSVHELGFHGWELCTIREVGVEDAARMLKAYADHAKYNWPETPKPGEVEELCQIAGGLPLAIRLVGEYLGRHADEISTLVDELRARGIRNVVTDDKQMMSLVEAAWEGLSTEGVLLASILSLFNAPPNTWTLAGGIRRNDRSDAARRMSARDLAFCHEGATSLIHSILQDYFIQKLESGAVETSQVWDVLVEHFVFQQFIYDSQYLANALDTVKRVQGTLSKTNPKAQLVLDKLVAHACYEKEREEALDCFSRLLEYKDREPIGIERWYAIFAADHAQNLLITRIRNESTKGFGFKASDLEETVRRLLPQELLSLEMPPSEQALPYLLRAAHFWGHQGNQRSYQLFNNFEDLDPDSFATKEQEGCQFYRKATIFRLASLRLSHDRAFRQHVAPLLGELDAPDWLIKRRESPDTADASRDRGKPEFSIERFNSEAQGFGDAAHQIRGLGDVQIWAYLYSESARHSGVRDLPGPSPDERLTAAQRTLALARKIWTVAKQTERHGEKPIQYYLWLADLEEKVMLAEDHHAGRDIGSWSTVQQRVTDRQRALEKTYGLRYEWARSKSIDQLSKFHRILLELAKTRSHS